LCRLTNTDVPLIVFPATSALSCTNLAPAGISRDRCGNQDDSKRDTLCVTTLPQLHRLCSVEWYDESVRTWYGITVAYFKVLFKSFPETADEIHNSLGTVGIDWT